jgi:radical S-adenosyl methionine domain-containing protein 2
MQIYTTVLHYIQAISLLNQYKIMFKTASFHIVKPCNMGCKFCYATFDDMKVSKQLSLGDTKNILQKLKTAGLEKITFAGGEPMLYRWLYEAIEYSKNIGLTTSIITNGSLLDIEAIKKYKSILDWIGISVDSVNFETNQKIGRVSKLMPNYFELIDTIKNNGIKLKINTVVNRYNQDESLQDFIDFADPNRWKIFDTLRVEGQNDLQFEEIRTTENGFNNFVNRHKHRSMVVENNEAMTGSYLLIDPQGRLFENSKGFHTYSDPLQNSDVNSCLSQISLDTEMFVKRGGIYNW